MKNYQKPMVNVEMINVEDVITASDIEIAEGTMSNQLGGSTSGVVADAQIVFEW